MIADQRVRLVARLAHAQDHILDDWSEENAQTGDVTVEIPAHAWKELNAIRDQLGEDPHEVLHELILGGELVNSEPCGEGFAFFRWTSLVTIPEFTQYPGLIVQAIWRLDWQRKDFHAIKRVIYGQ